jgi:hypothetical protein
MERWVTVCASNSISHLSKMRAIDDVLDDLETAGFDPFALEAPVGIGAPVCDVGQLPCRAVAGGIVPDGDEAVFLDHWPAFERGAGTRRDFVGVRNPDAGTAAVELPAMERTADAVADDDGAGCAKVCAEVRTIGVEYGGLAVFTAKQHEILIEVVQLPDIANGEFLRKADDIPAARETALLLIGVAMLTHCLGSCCSGGSRTIIDNNAAACFQKL